MNPASTSSESIIPPALPCPFGGDLVVRYRFPHAHSGPSRPFALYWSEQWKYGQIHPVPTDEELARLYDHPQYDAYLAGQGNSGSTQRSLRRRLIDMIIFRLANQVVVERDTDAENVNALLGRPSDVLDVGCGSGVLIGKLSMYGHRVLGLEPNAEARRRGIERGIEVVEGSGEDVSRICQRRFDLVMMVQSLEHTREPLQAIRNCASRLKPGGLLWIEVPNHEAYGFTQRGPVWFHTDAGRHIHFFSGISLQKALSDAGLDIVETRFSGYGRQFTWIDAEIAVWDRLYAHAPVATQSNAPPRPDEWSRVRLFAATRRATPNLRCDSVRVVARKSRATFE